ncbi:EAL domain-containing protein [Nakamurella sp. YIM 132087]|uniref:EAL domain-containing protein n=1 Tax=Nakamurella alba TaxID=2665158 RepID=A0A7K1FTF5_9ACTN|nr:EAL domain-containing protein [Nakamurella alba]MTD16453.1 EAL domain-containing protein [Nakamurella alba]
MSSPDWSTLLDEACRGRGLRSVYQPIVDVARGRVTGYESLTRFDAAPADPAAWFAAARRLGREAELEAATLRSALAGRRDLPGNCFLSLNVAPTALSRTEVQEVWAEQGDLRGVVVELTEQTQIDSYARLEPELASLRARGALIAIDDAGAGYAGLNHLVMLRPEIIKLDRGLVADLDLDETKRALVEMIGTFASRMDAWLLAEGIERAGELDALIQLGVPLAQGYYLARPAGPWADLEPSAVGQLVSRGRRDHGPTIGPLLQHAPAVYSVAAARAEFDRHGVEVVVLLDDMHRPAGMLTPDTAVVGMVSPAMRMGVDTPIATAALRMLGRDRSQRFQPAPCTDESGRYLGVVHMERLVHALALAGTPIEEPAARIENRSEETPFAV